MTSPMHTPSCRCLPRRATPTPAAHYACLASLPTAHLTPCLASPCLTLSIGVHLARLQARREALCSVAEGLASPLVVQPETSPTGPLRVADGQQRTSFATFLKRTLDRPAVEVRQLAADGPDNFETHLKEATYTAGMYAGQTLRKAGVPV